VAATIPTENGQVEVLGPRALNRALLARQLLLEPAGHSALDAVDHLVGMQSQRPQAPHVGLWTRLRAYRPERLDELLVQRDVVRVALQRGTVHLVTAADCLALRPVHQPLYDRFVAPGSPYGRSLASVDVARLVEAARVLMEERPRTNAELRTLLGERWPVHDGAALSNAVRSLLVCVQVPPRGLWGRGGQAKITTAQAWLGRPQATADELEAIRERMVERYLAAYGPASVADAQTWCGLTRLGEVVKRLRPRLRVFRDENGTELFDLPAAPRPAPDTPAPVRFLPEYDNCLRSHADRARVMSAETRTRLATRNDAPRPTFLVDGFVRGTWRLETERGVARLVATPFRALTKAESGEVVEAAGRLVQFVAPKAGTRHVEVAPGPDA
jgi:hypothetical protein